jgi:hypothetical protein
MSKNATVTDQPYCARGFLSRRVAATFFAIALLLPVFAAGAQQKSENDDKHLDIRSSVGDMHLGNDADARKIGLPLYPGSRLKSDDESRNKVNLGILTEAFGLTLVVANYDSSDAPAKVIDFYRDKLKKYGKVLECHSQKHGGDVEVHSDEESKDSKELKCDGNNTGPVTELKAGREDNQHVVAVEPSEAGNGSTFALVYVHTRGKAGEI